MFKARSKGMEWPPRSVEACVVQELQFAMGTPGLIGNKFEVRFVSESLCFSPVLSSCVNAGREQGI